MNSLTHRPRPVRPSRQRGFTLIEMLVVIVIMLILLGIIVASIKKLETSHMRGESVGRMRALSRALSLYRADYGDVPPYNPTLADVDGDGNPDPEGMGLYALVLLDYVQSYRFLNDAISPIETPWLLDSGGNRLEVVPDSPESLFSAYTALGFPNPPATAGNLTESERAMVLTELAKSQYHTVQGGTLAGLGDYDEEKYENFCSWMMQDPLTKEWKYQPFRKTSTYAVQDPTQPQYYHRQLSHRGTDEDNPRYLPASDTVITWSNLFRTEDTLPAPGYGKAAWGVDLVLYEDGHVATVPAPDDSGGNWGPARALITPPVQ